jgi:hypothetical protein
MVLVSLDILNQRVDHTVCARCRKKFKAGDRSLTAMIIKNPDARDPVTRLRAAEMSGAFELVHASCGDTALDGKLIIGE